MSRICTSGKQPDEPSAIAIHGRTLVACTGAQTFPLKPCVSWASILLLRGCCVKRVDGFIFSLGSKLRRNDARQRFFGVS